MNHIGFYNPSISIFFSCFKVIICSTLISYFLLINPHWIRLLPTHFMGANTGHVPSILELTKILRWHLRACFFIQKPH
ncbi:MAG: hypothetical protein CVU46_07895 [Chloroflexi bacterium HGW-Chloroflexi-8]|nr:MAG: hypothetical protein CVU46_07895 [Chloroflexi bacterium HGW-Chloroflexi-8]